MFLSFCVSIFELFLYRHLLLDYKSEFFPLRTKTNWPPAGRRRPLAQGALELNRSGKVRTFLEMFHRRCCLCRSKGGEDPRARAAHLPTIRGVETKHRPQREGVMSLSAVTPRRQRFCTQLLRYLSGSEGDLNNDDDANEMGQLFSLRGSGCWVLMRGPLH